MARLCSTGCTLWLCMLVVISCYGGGDKKAFPLAYSALYNPQDDVTDFLLPCGFTIHNHQILCASSGGSEVNCVNSTSMHVSLPSHFKGWNHLDLVVYNSGGTIEEPVPVRRRRLTYYTATLVDYPLYRSMALEVTRPPFGAISSGPLNIRTSPAQWSEYFELLSFSVVAVHSAELPSDMQTISTADGAAVEPGSWFYRVTPLTEGYTIDSSGQTAAAKIYGYPYSGYTEFVLTDEKISESRLFVTEQAAITSTSWNESITNGSDGDGNNTKRTVCLWSSQVLDGQRSVWLTQSAHLDPARFAVTWIVDSYSGTAHSGGGELLTRLQSQGTVVVPSPSLPLSAEDLLQEPGGGRLPASAVWAGNVSYLYLYAHESLVAANYSIDRVQPPWCRHFYEKVRDLMLERACDVTVLANDPRLSSNVLVVDVSRVLGIPTVAELSNLALHPLTLPDVVVAPSQFAARAAAAQLVTLSAGRLGPEVVVIPPSVDVSAFSPALKATRGAYVYPACVNISAVDSGPALCVVVGFVARLSPGNSTRCLP
jgi:hypothetical protein